MIIRTAAASRTGTSRQENQDAFAIGPLVSRSPLVAVSVDSEAEIVARYGLLVAVADGMGGYEGGALASSVVLSAFVTAFHGLTRENADAKRLRNDVISAVVAAHGALAEAVHNDAALANAGTTLAGIVVMANGGLAVFNVGDSRVVWTAGDTFRQLSVDHTPYGPRLARGDVTEDEAVTLSLGLTRYIGASTVPEPEFAPEATWCAGDTFAVGTDGWYGLSRGLDQRTIAFALKRECDAERACRMMVDEAVERDGSDNATVAVVRFEE